MYYDTLIMLSYNCTIQYILYFNESKTYKKDFNHNIG